jgi:hypothetical protein
VSRLLKNSAAFANEEIVAVVYVEVAGEPAVPPAYRELLSLVGPELGRAVQKVIDMERFFLVSFPFSKAREGRFIAGIVE